MRHLPILASLVLAVSANAADPAPPAPADDSAKAPTTVTKNAEVEIAGVKVSYRVVSSKLTLKKDDGTPTASIFHVSYLRDSPEAAKRPVIFAFNGGPGSSSVWLHLGLLGPKKIHQDGDGTQAPVPPARLEPNPDSILDVADLVFVDPVSTGFSRAQKPDDAKNFHGTDEDVTSLADFIRRWTTENGRWGSPKYLLGESYGGIRVSGLADELQSHYGMSLNGVVLLSSLLDFRTLSPSEGNDLAYQVYLPTYTSVALYHGKLKGDRDELVRQAHEFAQTDYLLALQKGAALDAPTRERIAKRLSELTSLPVSLIQQMNLRIGPSRFRAELLRSEGKVLGRFDARVAWPSSDPAAPVPDYDPSFSLALGAYSTSMMQYLHDDLGWHEEANYEILTSKVQPWNWGSDNSYLNLAPRLESAMRDNPHLRVLVMAAGNDLATPADGILYSLDHMMELSQESRAGIQVAHYDAGHMFYLNPPDLKKARRDLVDFLKH
jgi:carboxypeptidase C (cathepsin A)